MSKLSEKITKLLLLAVLLGAPGIGFGFALEPVPAGMHLVLVVHNHAGLKLSELVEANPMLPPAGKELFGNFVKATSFNPLTDVQAVQVMVRLVDLKPHPVVAATGRFEVDKLTAQIKLLGNQEIVEAKVGPHTVLKDRRGQAALCFVSNALVVAGVPTLVDEFLAARQTRPDNGELAPLLAKFNPKAYVTLMVAGADLFKEALAKGEEKRAARGRKRNAAEEWLYQYLTGDFTGHSLYAHLLDDRVEAWLTYDRGANQNVTIHLLAENTDPKLHLADFFAAVVKMLPTLPAQPGHGSAGGATGGVAAPAGSGAAPAESSDEDGD